jgi:hypothetical protein
MGGIVFEQIKEVGIVGCFLPAHAAYVRVMKIPEIRCLDVFVVNQCLIITQGSVFPPLDSAAFEQEGMMVSYDSAGKKISEINVIIQPDGGTVTSSTIYCITGRS